VAGIAGIAGAGRAARVEAMLEKMSYRGPAGGRVWEKDDATLGVVWPDFQTESIDLLRDHQTAADESENSCFARARVEDGGLALVRDPLGAAPLYYGTTPDGCFCFASEVKALLEVTADIHEFPPGHRYARGEFEPSQRLAVPPPKGDPPPVLARELRRRLETAIERRVDGAEVGSWLSGGLDSSAIAALARPHLRRLPTFAAGLPGAPDLEYARVVADYLDTDHHEVVVGLPDLLAALPDVIYHLESFDALLVRSSLLNFLASRRVSEHVPAVLSGEVGDELFAGYAYLRSYEAEELSHELVDLTSRLHNTALQRVDRTAAAHGTVALLAFTDPEVVDYALSIPVEYKLRDGVEKWILRRAMDGDLPDRVLHRKKAKFWNGGGLDDLLARHAEEQISDEEFLRERVLPNGWRLNSKEELLYYRIFREHFGSLENLSWMGRTKGAPGSD
jgi:asparagine synthase (glutamine-hydrolysing)